MNGEEKILQRLEGVETQLTRLNAAVTGDDAIGHKGLVPRLEKIELLAAEAPQVHADIEKRLAGNINAVADDAREKRSEIYARLDAQEGNWTRAKYLAIGIGVGSGIVSAGSVIGLSELLRVGGG